MPCHGIVSIYTSIFVRCDSPPKLRISSVIYLRLKPRNSASFEFPENLVDLVSSLIFLTLGHFHNSKTHKNLFNIPRKCASIHSTNGKVHFQSTPEKNLKKFKFLRNTSYLVSNENSVIKECVEHMLYTLGSLVS